MLQWADKTLHEKKTAKMWIKYGRKQNIKFYKQGQNFLVILKITFFYYFRKYRYTKQNCDHLKSKFSK
jgi:hypothetical protein